MYPSDLQVPAQSRTRLPANEERLERVMCDHAVGEFLCRFNGGGSRTRAAAKRLLRRYPQAPQHALVETVRQLLVPLRDQRLRVLLAYDGADWRIAEAISERLRNWSANKLVFIHLEHDAGARAARDWSEVLARTSAQCDWMLLLLPHPRPAPAWASSAARRFCRGHGLAPRVVCLHHPLTPLPTGSGITQSVSAREAAATGFLERLLHGGQWIPGMPPLNADVGDLDAKAREIVDIITGPQAEEVPAAEAYAVVELDDPSAVVGWRLLGEARVVDSSRRCRELLGAASQRTRFGDWLEKLAGPAQGALMGNALARAIRAAAAGEPPPQVDTTLAVAGGRHVRPRVGAIQRHDGAQQGRKVEILFREVEPPRARAPHPQFGELETLVIFAVRLRWELLARFGKRPLDEDDVAAFAQALGALESDLGADGGPGRARDARARLLALFEDEDRAQLDRVLARWHWLRRRDGGGELDQILRSRDGAALGGRLSELEAISERLLAIAWPRFGDLAPNPEVDAQAA